MLATNYKRDAIRYLECFEQFGDLNCAVVISPPDLRESVDDIDEGADDRIFRPMVSIASNRYFGTYKEIPSLTLTVLQHFHECCPFLICSIYFFCNSQGCSYYIVLSDIIW